MSAGVLQIARRVQAIAQAGLQFSKNEFDLERYKELRELSVQLASVVSEAPVEKIRDLFTYEKGFQTPKIDIRSVVLKDEKILLIKEKIDGKWAMPGGFADINISPAENAVKEVREEAGLEVKANRLLALVDCQKHGYASMEFHYYKIVFLCDFVSGSFVKNIETEEAEFFAFDQLPPLSEMRNNKWLFELIENLVKNNETYFD